MRHGVLTMRGRDPHESSRAATPLELLFDLTFVIAFGVAADELAHLPRRTTTSRRACSASPSRRSRSRWAWINFAWFASAYDTDDWLFRLTTMVQMFGVLDPGARAARRCSSPSWTGTTSTTA